jgi:hypothetical protein
VLLSTVFVNFRSGCENKSRKALTAGEAFKAATETRLKRIPKANVDYYFSKYLSSLEPGDSAVSGALCWG